NCQWYGPLCEFSKAKSLSILIQYAQCDNVGGGPDRCRHCTNSSTKSKSPSPRKQRKACREHHTNNRHKDGDEWNVVDNLSQQRTGREHYSYGKLHTSA